MLTWLKQELFTELQSIFYALEIGSQPDPPLAKFLALPRGQRVALFRQGLTELSQEFEPFEDEA